MHDEPENLVLTHLVAIRAELRGFDARLQAIETRLTDLQVAQAGALEFTSYNVSAAARVQSALDELKARVKLLEASP